MSIFQVNSTEEDIIHDFGCIFTYMGICESICPALATCRRSLDVQNSTGYASESDNQQGGCRSNHHGSTTVRLRGNTESDKGTISTTDDTNVDDKNIDKCSNEGIASSKPATDENRNVCKYVIDDNDHVDNNCVLLVSAYREHVGPGLKVM